MTNSPDTDNLIIGDGIARDAAGRDLRMTLCEKDDLAGATFSTSTNLIHGGLCYLENYEFGLVWTVLMARKALYLVHHEWACKAEDILWRRTKLRLKEGSDNAASLERWVDRRAA